MGVRPVPLRPATQAMWYTTVERAAGRPGGLGRAGAQDDPNVAIFGNQLKDTKAQPAIRDLDRDLVRAQRDLEKVTTGDLDPQAAADEMQQKAESIGTN